MKAEWVNHPVEGHPGWKVRTLTKDFSKSEFQICYQHRIIACGVISNNNRMVLEPVLKSIRLDGFHVIRGFTAALNRVPTVTGT